MEKVDPRPVQDGKGRDSRSAVFSQGYSWHRSGLVEAAPARDTPSPFRIVNAGQGYTQHRLKLVTV